MRTRSLLRLNQLVTSFLIALTVFFTLQAIGLAQDDTTTPLSGLTNEELWALLVGIAVPYITALINRMHWASDLKAAIFFVVTLATTAVTVWLQGNVDTQDYFRTFLLVLVSACLTYRATKPAVDRVTERTS